ncbi:hypothetical protein [Neotabrizicola sp. sgz301269]|uniref:hypothetical protein n=1 Tax=Neotabrizicola sp. sgz301269 TaxID=3276282 RepID=UPI0037700B4A
MALHVTHDLHKRRFSRNVGLGLLLAGMVVLVFALTVVKVKRGDDMQGYDHTLRPELLPAEEGGPAPADLPATAPGAAPEAGQ